MRIPAIAEIGARGTSLARDSLMTNFFPEKREGEWEAAKRTGTVDAGVVSPSSTGHGVYYWENDGKFYTAAGTKLYRDAVDTGITTPGNGVGFAEAGAVTKRLFVDAKTAAWQAQPGGTLTAISDADYTGTIAASPGTVGTPVELDGYIFVARADGRIFHSDNVDEAAANINVWDPDNYISVTESDTLHAILKHSAFVAAVGDKAVEFFYDAGNVEGSVLSPVQASVVRAGVASASTIATIGDVIFYVGAMSKGGYGVIMIEKMLPSIISTPQVERVLGGGIGHQAMTGMCCSLGGHRLYVLTVGAETIAFDIASKQWSKVTPWPWKHSTVKNGDSYMQHGSSGFLAMASEAWQDFDGSSLTNITSTLRSPAMEFGVPTQKRMKAVGIETNKVDTAFTLRYSDDDFSTWSAAASFPLERPVIHALGRFFRRSLEISHTANEDARVKALHIEIG